MIEKALAYEYQSSGDLQPIACMYVLDSRQWWPILGAETGKAHRGL